MKAESVERVEANDALDQMSITELLANGKRDFLVGNLPNALKALQRAVALSSAKYGTFAIECGEAYYLFGCALLDRARSENEVLGEAVKDVPLGEKSNDGEAEAEGEEKGSGVVSDSEVDGVEPAAKTDREKLAEMVIDALCKEAADGEKPAEGTSTAVDASTADQKAPAEGESKAEAGAEADSTTKPKGDAEATSADADGEEDEEEGDEDGDEVDSNASTDGASGAEGGAGDAEERTTLGVAWEWLDLARIVFEKRSRTLNGDEPSTSRDGDAAAGDQPQAAASSEQPEAAASASASGSTQECEMECLAKHDPRRCEARLADSHVRLGEVLMERAEFEAAIGEFETALRIREKQREASVTTGDEAKDEERVDSDLRALAETHFQLALANQNGERYDDAIRSFERAVETLTSRRGHLTSRLERSEKESESAKKLATEIEDLDGCISDLRQRITDAIDEKRFKALAQSEAGASTTPFGATSDAGTGVTPVASDVSHLVKRKRKDADGVDHDGEGDEKENGNGVVTAAAEGDGVPAKARKVEVEQDGTANA